MRNLVNTSLAILLVDDETETLYNYRILLSSSGFKNILALDDSRQVLPLLKHKEVNVILLDLMMPHISGDELLKEITQRYPHIPVIIVTGKSDIADAVECMKSGAFDYLVKPVENSRFISSIERALELTMLRETVHNLKRHMLSGQLDDEAAFSAIETNSSKMLSIFHYIESVAKSMQPVLITGETGVGKELIANATHLVSSRKGTFVAVNIAGLDDTVFSDTLFGHKKGAYTGAEQSREGLVARSNEGTLFLDEIGDLQESSQIKLLRLLQEQRYYPLGSDVPKSCNVRIIVSTNQDLKKLIRDGKFRSDIYYRLRTHHIHVPPLRERPEDIPLLLDHFLEEAAQSLGKKKPTPPPELITLLSSYNFPGNIRELRTMVFDAVARHKSGKLSMSSFQEIISQERSSQEPDLSLSLQETGVIFGTHGSLPTLDEAEDYLISEALKRAKGNQGIAASMLGISRQALNKRLIRKKYRPGNSQ
jgi:DNA-binding NtrC family response regulator